MQDIWQQQDLWLSLMLGWDYPDFPASRAAMYDLAFNSFNLVLDSLGPELTHDCPCLCSPHARRLWEHLFGPCFLATRRTSVCPRLT